MCKNYLINRLKIINNPKLSDFIECEEIIFFKNRKLEKQDCATSTMTSTMKNMMSQDNDIQVDNKNNILIFKNSHGKNNVLEEEISSVQNPFKYSSKREQQLNSQQENVHENLKQFKCEICQSF